MNEISAEDLREIVGSMLDKTIALHRSSRLQNDGHYIPPDGPPTDDEISDFLFHNILLDEDVVWQLIDHAPLGFSAKRGKVSDKWLNDFRQNVDDWAHNNSWLGADQPIRDFYSAFEPIETDIWQPASGLVVPNWVNASPSYILLALDLLKQGRLLSELEWRDFEKLIAEMLEAEGWYVEITQQTHDGGVDVIAIRTDPTLGQIRSVWQAKKYKLTNKVRLREVRELSAIREEQKATKGMMVTTSFLTRAAIDYIKRDVYRLDYKDQRSLEIWLLDYSLQLEG